MDKSILRKFAIESRKDLKERIKHKIKTFYIEETFFKEQRGDLYVLSNDKHSLSLTNDEYQKRELLKERIAESSLEQVIEEAAYTWFNRIIAIRYMELNDFLPLTKNNQSLGIRVLSSKDNTPDPEILKFTNLTNPDLDINFKKEQYIELKDDNEKFKYVLLLVCKKLGKVIPQVFGGVTDYIDILIPDNLLNDTGFITKVITEVPEDNYNQVEIIGWLYQYYIFDLKDLYKEQYKKYDKKTLPIMTQIFTTDTIVKYMVENSITEKLLENKIDIREKCNYYLIKDSFTSEECKKITDIKFIDPCCGSGHILVYAFDIFYYAYQKLGYNKKDIPSLILNNNIYGIDIDDRAVQLAILTVLLKAREYDKDLFNKNINLDIISIHESNNIYDIYFYGLTEQSLYLLDYLKIKFKDAKEYGSILKIDNNDYLSLYKEILNTDDLFAYSLKKEIKPIIKQAQILSQKYDILVTNPPYLGIRYFSDKLKAYAEDNYLESKHDLCTMFMESPLLAEDGILGMVNQTTWLTQDSFSSFRKDLLNKKTIMNMLILDKNVMDAGLDVCTFIIKNQHSDDYITSYYKVSKMSNNIEYSDKYEINNNKFLKSKDCAILYNLSNTLYDIYQNSTPLSKVAPTKQGLATSDNNRFLREWYEVVFNKIGFNCDKASFFKWYPCNKGGNYRKWYGNFNKIINWENEGQELKEYASKLYKSYTRTIKNIPLYFRPGITWNSLAKELGCRIVPQGFIFETKGSMMFPQEDNLLYILGLTNSKVINTIARVISPTLDFHEGPVGRLPVILNKEYKEEIEKIVKENIEISKRDWDSYEISWNFKKHPLMNGKKIKEAYKNWEKTTNDRVNQLKINEEKLNEIFIDIYGLKNELTSEVEEKDITINKADLTKDIKSLISYAVGCMFGRYSLDEEGLTYAGGTFDLNKYKSFKIDLDNVIPITDEAYFTDDIVSRFKEFIKVSYGSDTLNDNIDFIAETLGKKGTETSEDRIRRYFNDEFYFDHLKIYQKRPIYWLFDSGKNNGFKCLIYLHRFEENTIPKIRLDYLHRIQTTYEEMLLDTKYKLTTDLSVSDKKEIQKRQVILNNKLQEIREYDEKIAHISNQRIIINLDDGVKENYTKFETILAKIK